VLFVGSTRFNLLSFGALASIRFGKIAAAIHRVIHGLWVKTGEFPASRRRPVDNL
jgi:hypothetical protein